MNKLSRAEVAHLARLARLALTDEEPDDPAGHLDAISTEVVGVGQIGRAAHTTKQRDVLDTTTCKQ